MVATVIKLPCPSSIRAYPGLGKVWGRNLAPLRRNWSHPEQITGRIRVHIGVIPQCVQCIYHVPYKLKIDEAEDHKVEAADYTLGEYITVQRTRTLATPDY